MVSKFIPVIVAAIAMLAAAGASTLVLKLTHPPAHAAQSLDPAILHMQLQRARDEMALP